MFVLLPHLTSQDLPESGKVAAVLATSAEVSRVALTKYLCTQTQKETDSADMNGTNVFVCKPTEQETRK